MDLNWDGYWEVDFVGGRTWRDEGGIWHKWFVTEVLNGKASL